MREPARVKHWAPSGQRTWVLVDKWGHVPGTSWAHGGAQGPLEEVGHAGGRLFPEQNVGGCAVGSPAVPTARQGEPLMEKQPHAGDPHQMGALPLGEASHCPGPLPCLFSMGFQVKRGLGNLVI